MRFIAICALVLILAMNIAGFAFLAFGWFIGVNVQVKGGLITLLISAVVVVLCVRGIRWLRAGGPVALPTVNRI
jgi:ABC-type multidrug transport system permease subunit